jgi:putative ABC transport system permease protein
MGEMFDDALSDRARSGWWSTASLCIKTMRDLIFNIPAAHLRRRPSQQGGGTSHGRNLLMDSLFSDIRYACRSIIKNPLFTTVAIVTLGFGIGVNSAIFTVVNGVLMRPLPYTAQDKLLVMWTQFPDQHNLEFPVSPAEFLDYRSETEALAQMGAYGATSVTITGDGNAERLAATVTTRGLFAVLGVRPLVGRIYSEEEDAPGGPRVVLISHGYWNTRFGGDPGVVGTASITANGRDFTVIGVMPPEIAPPSMDPAIYFPAQFDRGSMTDRSGHWLNVVARLAPGHTLQSASVEMATILSRWEEVYGDQHTTNPTNHPMFLISLEDQLFGDVRPTMWILLASVGMVLLLACANVANLLLARAETRVKEMGVRSAIGAPRGRLIRQLLTESVVLAIAGGGLGLLLSVAGTRFLLALEPGNLPRLSEVSVDWRVVTFTAAVSMFTGFAFGLAPAWKTSRVDVSSQLRSTQRSGTAGRDSRRMLNTLVVAQTALAIVLLVGSGLLIKSFVLLQRVDPGFDPDNRIGLNVSLANADYGNHGDVVGFYDALLEQIEAIPGVTSAAAARGVPMRNGIGSERFLVEGRPTPPDNQEPPGADFQAATPGYFSTMSIPVIRGREFADTDQKEGIRVVLINEAAARMHFPGEDPVGQRIRALFLRPDTTWLSIVGVVGDVRHSGLDQMARPELYLPYAQISGNWAPGTIRSSGVVVRTQLEATTIAPAVREIVRRLDPNVPVTDVATLSNAVADSVSSQRFVTLLLGIFAAVALFISAVGVYGVISFTVARRTQEIGIRIALGAEPARVLSSVLGSGLTLAALGSVAGTIAAFFGSRMLETLVYGISVRDVTVFAGATLTLLLVATVASVVPAHRASTTDPITSLRTD